jgi:hypothetical protein
LAGRVFEYVDNGSPFRTTSARLVSCVGRDEVLVSLLTRGADIAGAASETLNATASAMGVSLEARGWRIMWIGPLPVRH